MATQKQDVLQSVPSILAGRTAFVTGAGQGNGRAIALGLAAAGARVVVTDIREDTVGETAAAIRQRGGEAWAYALDVASTDACEALASRVEKEVGKIDLLVNNAGIIIREGYDTPNAVQSWRKTMDVNAGGTFNVTHAFLPALKATRGTVVNISSVAAYAGQVGSAGYSPSKGAIKMLTQTLAIELAPSGVRVNAIAPGVIDTPMTKSTRENPKRLETFMLRIPAGRLGQPEDLVGPVIFLSSAMSAYVTGVTIPVDGGFLAG